MNTIETENTTVAAESANNIQNEVAAPLATPKVKVGRPRTNLTKEVVFVQKADGSITRRGKGKPAHDSKAMVYSVAWDYKGDSLPEESMFLRMADIKDTRKPKQETAATANPAPAPSVVVPSSADMLPLVV